MGQCYSKSSKKDDGYSLNQNSDKADNINMETAQISIGGEKENTPVPDQQTEISALKTDEIKVIRVHAALQASGNPVDADFISNQSSDGAENNVTEVTQITPAAGKENDPVNNYQTAISDYNAEENIDVLALDPLLFKGNRVDDDCLRKNLVILCENMDAAEISVHLESKNIFTRAQADEIRAAETAYKVNQRLIDLVRKRGPKALLCFLSALEETGQRHLAEMLCTPQRKSNESSSSFQKVQKSLKEMYLQRFRKTNPFSLPFTFDIENTWVSLALKEEKNDSQAIEVHAKLLEQAFKKAKMLIIEGNPATGKTSLMRRLAYEWAIGKKELSNFDLFIYAEFREVREQPFETVADLAIQFNKKYNKFIESDSLEYLKVLLGNKRYCEEQKILLLLDGYDESSLDEQCKELSTFIKSNAIESPLMFHVVLTTRPGYLSMYRGNDGRYVFAEVLGFISKQQKEKYITNHFLSKMEIDNNENIAAVHHLLVNNENLNKLAETPLFLTFICLVHERIVDGTLLELYCNIIWWLINRHQHDYPDRDIPSNFGFQDGSDDKFETIQEHYLHFLQLHCLSNMALHNLQQDVFKQSHWEEFNLQPIIEQVGLLRKEKKYDNSFKLISTFHFPHKTIQEFLAAFYCFYSNVPTNKWFLPCSKLNTSNMKEFERFLLRIALSDKMPLNAEKRSHYFGIITDIHLDITFEVFNTSAGFNHKLLNWFLSQCKNVQNVTLKGEQKTVRNARNMSANISPHRKSDSTSKMSNQKVFSFSELMKLSSLAFEYSTFEANSLLSITNCPSLKNLKFSYCSIENGTHLDFVTLPALDNVDFFKCTFETNSQLSFKDCLSVKNLIFIVCNMKSSIKFVIGTSSAIDNVEFILCETHLATWQSFTDAIRNSSGRCLKLSADYIVEGIYPGFLHYLQKCERVEEIYITDSLFLNRNEEEVTANLAEIARILPKLECIIIILDAYSRKLKEENKERIEKAGQERNPDFSIKYMEESLPGAEEANRVNEFKENG